MEEGVDRISNLPDPILIKIMSSLPAKTIVSTSILSKRWTHVWTEVPNLDFDESFFINIHRPKPEDLSTGKWLMILMHIGRIRFIEFVHRTLLRYKRNQISRFGLKYAYNGEHCLHICQFISFIIKRGVQELELDFHGRRLDSESRLYEIPIGFFAHEGITVLKLSFCLLRRSSSFRVFSKLKSLYLARVQLLTPELLNGVIRNCFFLEDLHLEKCYSLSNIRILNPNLPLQSLTIRDCGFLHGGLITNTPRLRSFEYFGHMIPFYPMELMPFVQHVKIEFELETAFINVGEKLAKLLWYFNNTMELTVCSFVLQVLPLYRNLRSLPIKLNYLVHLTIKADLLHHELPGIAFLLKISPNLETLSIEMGNGRPIFGYYSLRVAQAAGFNQTIGKQKDHSLIVFQINSRLWK